MAGPVNSANLASLALDARDTAWQIVGGDKYGELCRPWRELIRGVSEVKGQSFVQTAVDFLADLQSVGLLDGGAAMWILAAFSEEALAETEDCP